jgi:hypothetical protein
MVEMRSRLAYRKSESGNPPPTDGAPELYPNQEKIRPLSDLRQAGLLDPGPWLFALLIFACLQDIISKLSTSAATKTFCYPSVLQRGTQQLRPTGRHAIGSRGW